MKKAILSAICFLFVLLSCRQDDKKSTDTFTWLSGSWEMKENDGTVTEEWKQVNDSLMEGQSDFIKGDSVIPFETIRLYRKGLDFLYEAKAAGQNGEQPVAFKITSFTDSSFIAENPSHDFPKKITYLLITNDSIHAFVDDGKSVPEKRADFYYKRNKN